MTDWHLRKLDGFLGVPGPVVVCVMDGVGIGAHDEGDAVFAADTPVLDRLARECPTTQLWAHGTAVGMPTDADMGNSEVGHNALGAGRIFDQGAKLVDAAIASGAMFEGQTWRALVANCVQRASTMHFIGLLSDGNVHSHVEHLFAMLRRCAAEGVQRARVHVLLDGRDVPETSALEYVEPLEALLSELSQDGRDYRIASGGGRMTTSMDRYNADWSIVERGWKAHVRGEARAFASTREAIETLRRESPGVIDQNLGSFAIVDTNGHPVGPIRDGDSVVLFNFRGDRAIELSRAFEEADFAEFERGPRPDALFAGMMRYDGDLGIPERFLVDPPTIERTLGEYLAHNGVFQLAISETQKFGHVTYFWNGNRSGMFDEQREKYIEIPSDRISFDERPKMKAVEITDAVIEELQSGRIGHARLNYANGDMVGHTGNRAAAIEAVATVDACVGRLLPVIQQLDGALIVTADHGNADEMYERNGKDSPFKLDANGRPRAKTSHSLNRVPFHIYAPGQTLAIDTRIERPTLANVAATVLNLKGYQAPTDYEPSLLKLG
jgi:2,3-bisphosphoglycerate-independent phosphoglycerate mutase